MTATGMHRSFFSIFPIESIDNTERDVRRQSCMLGSIFYQICEVEGSIARDIVHLPIIFDQGSKLEVTSVVKQLNVFKLAWELL